MRDKLEKYLELLITQNEELNLTAIEDPNEVWVRHFEDSAQLLTLFNFTGARVLDIGAGAGFPGIPVRIGEPKMRLTLLDATDKKVEFLRLVCDELELTHVNCVHGRAEEFALKSGWRDGFDFVTARGLARLNVLCELAMPFLRIGGRFLAMKESDCDDEIKEAKTAIATLKGEFEETKRYTLSNGKAHAVIVIRKTDMTPNGYPRRYARIKSKPL